FEDDYFATVCRKAQSLADRLALSRHVQLVRVVLLAGRTEGDTTAAPNRVARATEACASGAFLLPWFAATTTNKTASLCGCQVLAAVRQVRLISCLNELMRLRHYSKD